MEAEKLEELEKEKNKLYGQGFINERVDLVQFVKERKKKDVGHYKAKNEHWKLICSGQPLQRIRPATSAFRNYSSTAKEFGCMMGVIKPVSKSPLLTSIL
ncbi:hypothetical protein FNV43_RR16996 [Rhamnella rubrinervis]|uniref:Uncharacterized protein n=1 Tax=Rhamnella rubrinervis TaxID=2594499 RepID=A0A8K0ME13_9ROSA|nr:hypothetical protein FNV43_RR16996 [Rhamnella rubrinervis]